MGKRKFYRIGALAITLSMLMGSVAFASTASTGSDSKASKGEKYSSACVKSNKDGYNLKSHLDSLVISGTITKAEEDVAIQILAPTKDGSFQKTKDKINLKLDSLVTAGTITTHEKDVVIKLLTQTKDGDFKKMMNKIRVNLGGLCRKAMQ